MAKEPVSRPSGGGGGKSAPSRSAPSRSKADMRDDRPSGGRSITPVAKPISGGRSAAPVARPISGGGIKDVRAQQQATVPMPQGFTPGQPVPDYALPLMQEMGITNFSPAGIMTQATADALNQRLGTVPGGGAPAPLLQDVIGQNVGATMATVPRAEPLVGFENIRNISAVNDPYSYTNMAGRVPGAPADAPGKVTPSALPQGPGFAPTAPPSIGGTPSAPAPVTPGRMMPKADSMATRASIAQYSPSIAAAPATSAPLTRSITPSPQPVDPSRGLPGASPWEFTLLPETISPDMFQYARPAPSAPLTRSVTPTTDLGGTQTVTPATQTGGGATMSPDAIGADAASTAPGTPPALRAGVVPGSLTSPGLGLLAGAQNLLSGGFRDAMSGLFSGEFRDTRSPEQRASDWFASQREMDRGSDRVSAAPIIPGTDDSVLEDMPSPTMPTEKPAWWPDYLPWPPRQTAPLTPAPVPPLPTAPVQSYTSSYGPTQSAITAGLAGMPMRFS